MAREIYKLHAEVCQTLSSPKRLEILDLLSGGEKSVSELAELTGMIPSNVSQHLAILRGRGLVTTRREGTNIYYRIANPKIIQACNLIREVLLERLEEAAELVRSME
ncbi:MAG: ArsR/SmtB family transcription factor [Anaerolineae bacterium]